MKCSIDNKPPREGSHLKTKAKKNFLIDERMGQIETENRILLQKMTNIMRVSFCYFVRFLSTFQDSIPHIPFS